jgi:hypothetical protein
MYLSSLISNQPTSKCSICVAKQLARPMLCANPYSMLNTDQNRRRRMSISSGFAGWPLAPWPMVFSSDSPKAWTRRVARPTT